MKVRERGVLPESNIYFYTPKESDLKLFLVLTSCGHYFCDENYQVARENYGNLLLLHVKKGNGFVYVDDTKALLNENDTFLLDCRKRHRYGAQAGAGMEIIWAHLEGVQANEYFKKIAGKSGCAVLRPRNPQNIYNNLYSIYRQFHEHSDINSELASVSVFQGIADKPSGERGGAYAGESGYSIAVLNNRALVNVLTEFLLDPLPRVKSGAISEDILNYITNNIEEPLSLEKIAARASLSPYYFVRRFKKETGYTPHQYVLIARINAAKFYLKNTPLTVKEIAFSCGFTSESSFCVAFRHIEGMTPLSYREKS